MKQRAFNTTEESIREDDILKDFFLEIILRMLNKYGKNFFTDVVESIKIFLNVDVCALYLMEKDAKTLTLYADDGYLYNFKDRQKKLIAKEIKYHISDSKNPEEIPEEGITAWVARTGTPFSANSFDELKKHPSHAGKWDRVLWDNKPDERFKSLYAVPLKVKDRCLGVLKVENKRDKEGRYISFSGRDKKEFEVLANNIAAGIDKIKQYDVEDIYLDIGRIIVKAAESVKEYYGINEIKKSAINNAFKLALDSNLLINNLAETFRITPQDVKNILSTQGLDDIVAQAEAEALKEVVQKGRLGIFKISELPLKRHPFNDLFNINFANPDINDDIEADPELIKKSRVVVNNVIDNIQLDPFLNFYRNDVMEYYHEYQEDILPRIHRYIMDKFGPNGPEYLVTSGIGANEQFNHFIAILNNTDANRKLTWFICNAPKELRGLPGDANENNTLFMEFSRSGKTEETVKVHEFTPRNLNRIVFANSNSLKEIALRDNNLLLPFPDEIPGRFGRNKTPILLAPMDVAGMDTKLYWEFIDMAIKSFDINDKGSLPVCFAKYLYYLQLLNKINHIYFGCNNDILMKSADEMIQFWNEGANKRGNDITMSRYFGLPRDSHANLEAILGNSETKMGIFLIYSHIDTSEKLHPFIRRSIDPIDKSHTGIRFGGEEIALAMANYQRCCEKMPTILIEVKKINLKTSAILGQLWADITYIYSRFKHIDPGSNPEVRFVRDRAAKLLAQNT